MKLTDAQQTAIFEALGAASVCWDREGIFQSERAQEIGLNLIKLLQGEHDRPLCASQYRDDWGHVWECEKEWGHWGTEPEKQHIARIPHGWQYANMAPLMVWPSSRAIR